jgi:hypothetical protein
VRIEGLETLDYLDNLSHKEEQGDAITFESEVDRVCVSSPNVVAILDHEKKRSFLIRKEGLPDVVVWNPWENKSKTMVDLVMRSTSRCFALMRPWWRERSSLSHGRSGQGSWSYLQFHPPTAVIILITPSASSV